MPLVAAALSLAVLTSATPTPDAPEARPAAQPSAYQALNAAWIQSTPRPFVEGRLAGTGLVGSLGLHHAVDSHPIDPVEINNAAGQRLYGPDSTMGARLSLKF
ncbi:MAG: hypothetical protein JOZ27_01330 [Caulobacteraceae bacterium]|nr:hypothetical protein [Caulobacteraceae bacterium]